MPVDIKNALNQPAKGTTEEYTKIKKEKQSRAEKKEAKK